MHVLAPKNIVDEISSERKEDGLCNVNLKIQGLEKCHLSFSQEFVFFFNNQHLSKSSKFKVFKDYIITRLLVTEGR